MVPATGFEPVRCYSLEPESSAFANSATRATDIAEAQVSKALPPGASVQLTPVHSDSSDNRGPPDSPEEAKRRAVARLEQEERYRRLLR